MSLARMAKALETLSQRVEEGFAQVDARFAQVDERFAQVDARFAQVDARFAQVDARFAQVDERFAQVDARFAQTDGKFHADLEQFAEKITNAFKINLERMEAKLDSALDDTREQRRRLDAFERTNAEEHRLLQAQIDDLDSKLPPRRGPRRRPS